MKTNQKLIATINSKAVSIVESNGAELVPIRPICEILEINYPAQVNKIKTDEILSSTVLLGNTVGADVKQREMVCLPLGYIFDWLVFISPSHLINKDENTIRAYYTKCCNVLYYCFSKNRQSDQPLAKEIE